ncbi:uncharacterized protein LOC126787175 [Argentina anserina]|uniref:uncharacterized protein LOC126787175 n=1 Tax=Argentina anserina TaxID=57926 RepID=UPI002176680E|nr:uncharacterized protein LOC126787175 [Potentilla anserina]
MIDELGIYFLLYDRAGYGESDPNPNRSVKSEAHIEELADQLQLGSKFYVIGVSMGSYSTWSCLKYIPPEMAPFNFCHGKNPVFFNTRDIDALKTAPGFPMHTKDKLRQKGVFDTLHNDFKAAFSHWDFDPMDLSNPFSQNQSAVHIWQGYEDKVVPFQLQRYISLKLPWIQYHEVPDGGHLIIHYAGLCETILRALLLGEELLRYKPITAYHFPKAEKLASIHSSYMLFHCNAE